MRFYQVDLRGNTGESFGYEYFATRREAAKRHKEWIAESGDGSECGTVISGIDVDCSKKGVLKLLNRYASHHDNG